MININLLPQDLRKKENIENKFDLNNLLYLIPAVIIILIFLHLYYGAISVSANTKLHNLDKTWNSMSSQKKSWDEFNKIYNISLNGGAGKQQVPRMVWSQKLNLLSTKLPAGIWFNELSVIVSGNTRDFLLKASVVSLAKQEVALINKFLNNLKEDKNFMKEFIVLELGPVDRSNIGGCDIVNFTITGKLK